MAFIASQLVSKEETKDLEMVFKQMDKNGDGVLTKEEVMEGYEEVFGIQLNEDEIDRIFKNIDLDGSGALDYTEWVIGTLNDQVMLNNQKLKQAFEMFDKDKSGTISADEIKQMLGFSSALEHKLVQDIISEVDENGDGEIQFEEFIQMMNAMTRK